MIVVAILLSLLLVGILGVLGYGVAIYNGLVALKNNINRNWSNIDVLLKQRYDEIPKLVEVCKGYMKHERETLEAVIKARSNIGNATSEKQTLDAQTEVSNALLSLFAVSEKYPNLKADQAFLRLQSRISELEDQIADRREFFNESVNLYNIRIEQIPDAFVANTMHYTKRTLWKIDPAHRDDVKVSI
jgi:LemA protein